MLLVIGTLHTETAFFIAAPIMGVTAFVCAPLLAAMVAEIAGPALVGSATGMTNAFWQLGNVLVPLAVGVAYQSTNSFGAAQRNVELMWLTGRLAPDFKTIADFRRANGVGIRNVCRRFVVL
jgi:MFS family permease